MCAPTPSCNASSLNLTWKPQTSVLELHLTKWICLLTEYTEAERKEGLHLQVSNFADNSRSNRGSARLKRESSMKAAPAPAA